ncbi:MAG TPA: fibrobacter succinogenes major paralogous domain-containing protein [Hanamia sp.]|nr:fibrobacter succinogenes major paralogous domain-containing protein [Hanamia sp.]
MKKLLLPLLTILFIIGCKKQTPIDNEPKVTLCHYDAATGKDTTIQVNKSDVAAHLAQGDVLGNCSAVVTTICSQDWMIKNLDVSTFRNGDSIPEVSNPAVWTRLTTPAWCHYNNDPANDSIYGKLYNWYALTDPRGIAPVGWHVPSDSDWSTLTDCLGGEWVAGGALKESGYAHWASPNLGATNSSGFTALPVSYRHDENGSFEPLGFNAYWWAAPDPKTNEVWYWTINYQASGFGKFIDSTPQNFWFAIRCVRD